MKRLLLVAGVVALAACAKKEEGGAQMDQKMADTTHQMADTSQMMSGDTAKKKM